MPVWRHTVYLTVPDRSASTRAASIRSASARSTSTRSAASTRGSVQSSAVEEEDHRVRDGQVAPPGRRDA